MHIVSAAEVRKNSKAELSRITHAVIPDYGRMRKEDDELEAALAQPCT